MGRRFCSCIKDAGYLYPFGYVKFQSGEANVVLFTKSYTMLCDYGCYKEPFSCYYPKVLSGAEEIKQMLKTLRKFQ